MNSGKGSFIPTKEVSDLTAQPADHRFRSMVFGRDATMPGARHDEPAIETPRIAAIALKYGNGMIAFQMAAMALTRGAPPMPGEVTKGHSFRVSWSLNARP